MEITSAIRNLLSQPKFLPSNGFLAHIAISLNEILRDYTIVLFEPRFIRKLLITQSWRNRGAINLKTIYFHGQGLQVQFYFIGFPLQNSVSSVISFQVFIPLNVSIFLLSFTLIRIYAQFLKTFYRAYIITYPHGNCFHLHELRFYFFFSSVTTLFSFQR